MKKKLLAVVLSVVMIAALLVPMMAISAAGASTATIGLGEAKIETIKNVDYIAIPVLLSDNTGEFFTARYQVISKDGLAPFNYKNGNFSETYEDDFGEAKTISLVLTCVPTEFDDMLQVVQDATSGTEGINTASGNLGVAYFVAPTAVGTYTFELNWMDGTDVTKAQYDMTVEPATVTYTVECKSHIAGEPEVTKAADCENAGEKVTKCTACGAEMKKETIPALGHDWDNGVVAENVKCGETADTTFTCKREDCGETKVEKGAVVNHDWKLDEEASVAPKCGVAGKNVYVCQRANCPEGTKEEAVEALEHIWELDEDACVAPKCGVAGKDVYVCTQKDCPVGTKEEEVEALEHIFLGELVVVTAPTAESEGLYTIACINDGCTEVEEYVAAKLATVVEHKDEDGKVIMGFKAENAILPEDILALPTGEAVEDKETGKISETIAFYSSLVDDLSGEVEFSLDSMGLFTNPVVTNAAGEVEFTFENGVLTFKADLAGEYTITYEEVKTSPDTSDATNTVVFAVVALMAIAGLVVVGKKRFAL